MTTVDAGDLAELGRFVLELDDWQRDTYIDSLELGDVEIVEAAIAAAELEGADWRETPATMAQHLTNTLPGAAVRLRLWPYVRLLGEKFRDAVEGRSIRQIWNMPPRYGKSLIASQWGPAWALDRNPAYRMLLVSYGDKLARENAGGCRDILRLYQGQLRAQLRQDRRAIGRFVTTAGGGILAGGIASALTGFGGHGAVFDDPFKDWQEAHSAARRNLVDNQFRAVVSSRLDFEDSWIIVPMTRWHEDDLSGRLIDRMQSETDGPQWDVVRIPELAEEPQPAHHQLIFRLADLLGRKPGEPIEPERFGLTSIKRKHIEAGCTPAETPILMADWTTKPISEVRAGDQVVGWASVPGRKMRLQATVVEATSERPGTVYDYRMVSGRTVRATRDHRWFTRAARDYRPANVGTPLRFVCPVVEDAPTADELGWWQYLAGIIDGEGSIRENGGVDIVQTLDRNGPVAARIIEACDRLGISHTDSVTGSSQDGWAVKVNVHLHQPGRVLRALVRHTHLAKRDQAVAALFGGAGRTERHTDRVVDISCPADEPVYALQTGTGNYIAWGYASSNSYLAAAMYQQRPAPEEGGEVKRGWFRLYDSPPDRYDQAIGSWDMKLKDKESGDYVVGQAWGRNGGGYWLFDQMRGQWNQATTENAIALMTVRHGITTHLVENTGNGPEVMAALRARHPGYRVSTEIGDLLGMTEDERVKVSKLRQRGMSGLIPVPAKGSKSVRMRAVSSYIEAGDVHIPNVHVRPWVGLYLDEMAAFPNGAHDDQVDATSQALARLAQGRATIKAAKGDVGKGPISTRGGGTMGVTSAPAPAAPTGPARATVRQRGRLIIPRGVPRSGR